jgi:hypothetical protein
VVAQVDVAAAAVAVLRSPQTYLGHYQGWSVTDPASWGLARNTNW